MCLHFFIGVYIDAKKIIKNVCFLVEIRKKFLSTSHGGIMGIFLL